MTSKQAQRGKQKKAQKRKQQLALRPRVAAASSGGGFSYIPSLESLSLQGPSDLLADRGVTEEDYLPNGDIKVSAALFAMAHDLLDLGGFESRDAASKLFTIVMAAWNIEVSEAMGRPADELIEGVKASLPADLHPTMLGMIANFRAIKRSLFPDDHRLLVSLDVVGPDGDWRVNVGSVAADARARPGG